MSIVTAILASGEGTTAEAFIRACHRGQVDASVKLIICNRQDAGIFKRIAKLSQELGTAIDVILISNKTHPAQTDEQKVPGQQTLAEENAIHELLSTNDIELVLSMGYLRRIGPRLVQKYGWRTEYVAPWQARMLNTHPGLLPESKGLWGIHVQEHVLEKHLPFSGQTLHVVAEDYDEGPVLAAHQIVVDPADTAESLFAKVQMVEKQYLPVDIQAFIKSRAQYILDKQEGEI